MKRHKILFWFRRDLRLGDNPGLSHAAKSGDVIPVYIGNIHEKNEHKIGAASSWWLHHSLQNLSSSLNDSLNFFLGEPYQIILELVRKYEISEVVWNRCYLPYQTDLDNKVMSQLKNEGIRVSVFNASLLSEPWEILKNDGTWYRVFTPYYRKFLEKFKIGPEVSYPARLDTIKLESSMKLQALGLLSLKDWENKLERHCDVGEKSAKQKLQHFIQNHLNGYKENRDFPDKTSTSLLSAHLHFGEISPHQVFRKVIRFDTDDARFFLRELCWREFSYYLLYHFPSLPWKNFQSKFDQFNWSCDNDLLKAWQRGETGYPIVDAGMRELWETGLMHNRVRMIVASFLTKNLMIHWHHGRDWFHDCLVDSDLASNCFGWQWVAGCGVDAAPYFRIFNPVTQGEKFDAMGGYIRKYVPELKHLPDKYLCRPWEASSKILARAGVFLGKSYPVPIVELKSSRERALQSYKNI
jgi:deoxyribodipyrimidine photo-lyase